jgi:hypothetical protein
MRSFCVLAVLSAVLSAAAAHACCLLKTAGPPPAAAPPGPVADARARVAAAPTAGAPYVEIESVGGRLPNTATDPWTIDPPPLPPGGTDVVVNIDVATGQLYPCYVYLEELTFEAKGAKAAAAPPRKYGWYRWRVKEITLPTNAAPTAATAGSAAAILRVFELGYYISSDSGKNYRTYAQAETYEGAVVKKSHYVDFSTSSGDTSPPGPPGAAGLKKK